MINVIILTMWYTYIQIYTNSSNDTCTHVCFSAVLKSMYEEDTNINIWISHFILSLVANILYVP